MSPVQEIEAAIPKLSQAELKQFHAWHEDYLEDHLDLTDAVKVRLGESRREIVVGNSAMRQIQTSSSLRELKRSRVRDRASSQRQRRDIFVAHPTTKKSQAPSERHRLKCRS